MKLNLKQYIYSLKGVPTKADGEEVTLGAVLANVVIAPTKNKKGFRPMRGWELAKKFHDQKEIDLDNSEVIQIKELLESEDQAQLPFIVAQTLEYIISAEKEKANNKSK